MGMNTTVAELVMDKDLFGLFTFAYTDLVGVQVFSTITGLLLMLVLYIYSRSVVVPAVAGLFIAGSIVGFLPARANYVAYVFLALSVSGILYRLLRDDQY